MDLSREPILGGQEPKAEDYCRAVEAYLCRKNDGHLIRIVGPSFERVCAWASRGVPLRVTFRGIDRYFERYYAKGPRRRPVHVDFCEADVLDVFDEWRRAIGITMASSTGDAETQTPEVEAGRRGSLPAHLDRAIARLTALRAGEDRTLDGVLDETIRELDASRTRVKGLRGETRDAFLARLADLDNRLVAAARARLGETALDEIRAEAEAELAPFRSRMPAPAYEQALAACAERLLRERARLPVLRLE